jgi:acyl carrier protein
MTRAEIEETVTSIIRKEKELHAESLQPATVLADAGIDSLDALTILFAIEEHFKIAISDTDARAIKTFGDMIDAIERLVPA